MPKALCPRTSKYLDFLLQPHVLRMQTYTRDTGDFISKIEGVRISESALILFLDIVSLYTCIPYDDVRLAVRFYLEQDSESLPPIHFLLDLVDILLENNYFLFNNNFFSSKKRGVHGQLFCLQYSQSFYGPPRA